MFKRDPLHILSQTKLMDITCHLGSLICLVVQNVWLVCMVGFATEVWLGLFVLPPNHLHDFNKIGLIYHTILD